MDAKRSRSKTVIDIRTSMYLQYIFVAGRSNQGIISRYIGMIIGNGIITKNGLAGINNWSIYR